MRLVMDDHGSQEKRREMRCFSGSPQFTGDGAAPHQPLRGASGLDARLEQKREEGAGRM